MMVTCVNCSREALYTYQISQNYLIHYCQAHLPKFLVAKKNAGLLALQVPAAPVVEEAPKTSKKKAVVEEKVEEPEVQVEEPAEDDATNS